MLRRLPAATVVAFLLLVAPAAAEQPLIGLLTGGELRSKGTATIAEDQVATDYIHDPATSENCIGPMCDDHKDLVHHKKAEIRFDTSWLLDGRYPGVPADPKASSEAFRWNARPGAWSAHVRVDDYAYPNDQGDGGNEQNPETSEARCESALVARMPDGAASPLISPTPDEGFFDPGKERKLIINAYGSTYNETQCGSNDRHGFWAFFGLVPAEGEELTWDLGTEPREATTWERVGVHDRTGECAKFGDESPRDTYAQCKDSFTTRATNTLECALCVSDIRYEHHDGGKGDWVEVPDEGTWDGNEVRITAQVWNSHEKTLTVPVLLRDKATKRVLAGSGDENPRTYTFPSGQMTKVQLTWRTDGFAWEKGKPRSERDVQLLTPYGGAQQRIVVRPRPVVLVHGWKSDAATWDAYKPMLKAIHPLWEGYAVGDGRFAGTMDTDPSDGVDIRDNAVSEHQYVTNLRDKLDADHVDIVAHSMGGLISRQYIHELMPMAPDGRPVARRLAMLGTPNMGSPCAYYAEKVFWGTPTRQLRPDFAAGFNQRITNRKGVVFSILAGDYNLGTCGSEISGDGVVEVPSAHWVVGDRLTTHLLHTSMTGDQHALDSYVKPRLALDPDEVKKLSASAASVPGSRARASRAGAAAAAVKAPVVQAVATYDTTVSGRKALTARFSKGAAPRFVFAAQPGMAAELIDPKGKVAARQPADSPEAHAPIRFVEAASKAGGKWTLRLIGSGAVQAAAATTGGADRLAVKAGQAKGGGAVTVTATLKVAGRAAPGAKVRAELVSSTGKRVKLTLKGGKRGRYSAKTTKQPAGTWAVRVTATKGASRLIATGQTGS